MAYYRQGDYYLPRGDYYRAQGDPFLGAVLGGVASLAGKAVKSIFKKAGPVAATTTLLGIPQLPPPPGKIPKKGIMGAVERLLPGGKTGFVKKKRMNPANPKALRRSLRRVAGFAKLAQRAKRDIGRAATAAGVNRGRGRRGGGYVEVNPTAARVKVS